MRIIAESFADTKARISNQLLITRGLWCKNKVGDETKTLFNQTVGQRSGARHRTGPSSNFPLCIRLHQIENTNK